MYFVVRRLDPPSPPLFLQKDSTDALKLWTRELQEAMLLRIDISLEYVDIGPGKIATSGGITMVKHVRPSIPAGIEAKTELVPIELRLA